MSANPWASLLPPAAPKMPKVLRMPPPMAPEDLPAPHKTGDVWAGLGSLAPEVWLPSDPPAGKVSMPAHLAAFLKEVGEPVSTPEIARRLGWAQDKVANAARKSRNIRRHSMLVAEMPDGGRHTMRFAVYVYVA